MKDYGIVIGKRITGGKFAGSLCNIALVEREWDYFDWALMNTKISRVNRLYISAAVHAGSLVYNKKDSCNRKRKVNHTAPLPVTTEPSVVYVKEIKLEKKQLSTQEKISHLKYISALPNDIQFHPQRTVDGKTRRASTVMFSTVMDNKKTLVATSVKPLKGKHFKKDVGFLWCFFMHQCNKMGLSKTEAKQFFEDAMNNKEVK